MSQDAIHAAVAAYYDAALAAHGPTARGVDWKDEASHRLRHAQFLRLIAGDPGASVLDLGCGYGDFLGVIRAEGHRGRYLGCDLAPGMIVAARALHGEGPDHAWHCGAAPPEPCDYAVASGLMNVRRGADAAAWAEHVEGIISTLAAGARRGFGFNMLSLSSDPEKRRADLHYADPVAMLEMCLRRFGRHVALLQDYGLWEFTVIVRHG
ncbi:MAG: class I SAM-dependent methyltransferase [Acetobacteraceae bacterium]|nr:class I SAM-dependent methyltransferase [Acetobacteraceae bacterium]